MEFTPRLLLASELVEDWEADGLERVRGPNAPSSTASRAGQGAAGAPGAAGWWVIVVPLVRRRLHFPVPYNPAAPKKGSSRRTVSHASGEGVKTLRSNVGADEDGSSRRTSPVEGRSRVGSMPRRSEPDVLAAAIGRRVRTLREARGLRLEQVAFGSGLTSKGHLSDLEHGRVNPTVVTLRAIADELGVSLVDLVNVDAQSPRGALIECSGSVSEPMLRRWVAEAQAEAEPAGARPRAREAALDVVKAERAPRGRVPLVDLEAAAGVFDVPRSVETRGWVKLDAATRALPGVFVARVRGDSMSPRVPDGAYCVFRRPAPGNRQGRVFLVQARGEGAPDDGGAYALKLVETTRVRGAVRVTLRSINPAHPPRTLDPVREDLRIVGELVRVLPG
jgi:transcriptional regulator with XRE-family HTH domain